MSELIVILPDETVPAGKGTIRAGGSRRLTEVLEFALEAGVSGKTPAAAKERPVGIPYRVICRAEELEALCRTDKSEMVCRAGESDAPCRTDKSEMLCRAGESETICRADKSETLCRAGESEALCRAGESEMPCRTDKAEASCQTGEPHSTPLRILFAIPLGALGVNLEYYRMLAVLRKFPCGLEGAVGGLLVDGDGSLYTKSVAGELVFAANCAGCAFVGRPLVEGTGTLSNFDIVAQNMGTDQFTAYKRSAAILVSEICAFRRERKASPNILALHASSHRTSNTFALWNEVKNRLSGCSITEIGLRNGTLSDCSGCPYRMCLHFGEKGSCFYGGVMVEDVYPAVREADAVVMLCPNYNDALSANLTAFINRLTALFRTTRFYDKALFAIVVSGYSGSDIVARQLICALNMNKTFFLPGHFAMLETANNAGTAMKLPGIEERIEAFSANIRNTVSIANDPI